MRLLPLLACVLAGCFGLGPRIDRTRYFTLAPIGSDEAAPASDLTLGLGPIVFPGYLDRMSVVRRTGANELAVSANDRWAEPLRDAFGTTLQQNLAVLLGTPRIAAYPWSRSVRPLLAVDVDVLHFEALAKGDAELAAVWHVVRVADGAVLVGRTSRIAEPASGSDTDAAVLALSQALGALSREIATAVHAEQAAGHVQPPHRPRA